MSLEILKFVFIKMLNTNTDFSHCSYHLAQQLMSIHNWANRVWNWTHDQRLASYAIFSLNGTGWDRKNPIFHNWPFLQFLHSWQMIIIVYDNIELGYISPVHNTVDFIWHCKQKHSNKLLFHQWLIYNGWLNSTRYM